jgi:hypothetical protein
MHRMQWTRRQETLTNISAITHVASCDSAVNMNQQRSLLRRTSFYRNMHYENSKHACMYLNCTRRGSTATAMSLGRLIKSFDMAERFTDGEHIA